MAGVKTESAGGGTGTDDSTAKGGSAAYLSILADGRRTGTADIIADKGVKKARALFTEEQATAYADYADACEYSAFVVDRLESKNITATIKEARPMLEIDPAKLDAAVCEASH